MLPYRKFLYALMKWKLVEVISLWKISLIHYIYMKKNDKKIQTVQCQRFTQKLKTPEDEILVKTYCLQFPVHCPRSICGFPSWICSLFNISILCFGSWSILAMNFFIFWKLMKNDFFWHGKLHTGYFSGDGRWNLNLLRRLSRWSFSCICSRILKMKF